MTVIGETSALIGAIAAAGAVVLGVLNRKKIQEVHILVNSQLTTVMGKLDTAMGKIGVLERAVVSRDNTIAGAGLPPLAPPSAEALPPPAAPA
jgi:hypothetical protein